MSDINAGHIRLSEATGDLDDIVDGANYGKVDVNDITSGHIILSTVSGDLDDVDDGDTYGKVAVTSISAGLVVLAGDGDSHVVLDGPNGKIYVNNSTFGNVGIQLDYNAGTPRFYCGDGSNNYFKFDGTNVDISSSKVDALVIKSGGNILIETGGDLVLIPDDSSPAKIDFANESRDAGQSFFIQRDVTYGYLYIVPETDNLGHLWLGSGANTWGDIQLYANNVDITSTHASYDLGITSAKDITLTATSGEISLTTPTIDVGSNGLTTLAKSGQGLGAIICYLKTSAPTPVSGMLCGYDGSGWNPHSTGRPGLTFYDGGTWRQVSA